MDVLPSETVTPLLGAAVHPSGTTALPLVAVLLLETGVHLSVDQDLEVTIPSEDPAVVEEEEVSNKEF